MGLRAALPQLRLPRGRTAHLAQALQLHPQPQLPLKPATHHPRSEGPEARHLESIAPGAIAQLGERLLCRQEVAGSIPAGSTTSRELVRARLDGGRAAPVVRPEPGPL